MPSESTRAILVFAVMFGIMRCRFLSMLRGDHIMSLRYMPIMPRGLMIAHLMMLGGFQIMSGSVLMVFSGFLVMFRTLV